MKKFDYLVRIFLALLLWLMAYGAGAASSMTTSTRPSKPSQTVKGSWQQEWEKTLSLAKKEGKLVILNSFGAEGREVMASAFKKKYGLDIEFVTGRTGDIDTKVITERAAGLFLEDVYTAGTTSLLGLKNSHFLDTLEPMLILPEALDTKVWFGGQRQFVDKERTILAYQMEAPPPLLVNTDLVNPDDIKSFRDLLNPKWKGKIVVMDPTMGSAGTNFFFILWELMGPDFTRELAKQDLVITRDSRQQAEWVGRGKYAISGSISADIRTQWIKIGAPIKPIQPVEGTVFSISKGALGVLNKAPHPNASKVFINWLLTKEGQTVMSRVTGQTSQRLDVTTEWVPLSNRVQPGVKYISGDTEEAIQKKEELRRISREIWNVQ